MFLASVCLSVRPSVRPSLCLSVCLQPKFGRLKTKFDEDAEGGSESGPEKLSSAPRSTYVFYSELSFLKQGRPRTYLLRLSVCLSVCLLLDYTEKLITHGSV